MKRLHSAASNDSGNLIAAAKMKRESESELPAQIFKITKVDPLTVQNSYNKSPETPQRETVWTAEEIAKMSPKQQYSYFQSQAYEIKQLRRKIRKCCQKRGEMLEAEILQTQEVMQNYAFELEDQKNVVENLVKAINQGALAPNTFPYDHLCTVIRSMMNIQVERKNGKCLQFPEKEVAISEREGREYLRLPNNAGVFRVLVGQSVQPTGDTTIEDEQKREVEWYLLMHGELLKKMTYSQFVNSMRVHRKK